MTAHLFLSKMISNTQKRQPIMRNLQLFSKKDFFLLYPNPKYFKLVLSIAINQYDDTMSL